jgi:hypothetical protein
VYTNNSHSETQRSRIHPCHPLPTVLCQPHVLSFHTLAHSFALTKKSTLLFSCSSALFCKNTRGGGMPSLSSRGLMKQYAATNVSLTGSLSRRTLPPVASHESLVTSAPVAAFPPGCYDLVFHDSC